ncbi:homeobox domain-containing protein [Aspergillus undulatus]|uniref:homeobox domain-containing protein n=1 Tax=Aspergillus undulatus TaxID=1810928 RepID=UPI003CCCEA9F
MSVSGPCAWVPTVPSPATVHSPAITNSWASVSWNSEQASSKSRVNLSTLSAVGGTVGGSNRASPVEMQPAAVKAENALHTQPSGRSSNTIQYSGKEATLDAVEGQEPNAHGNALGRSEVDSVNADIPGTEDHQTTSELLYNVKPEVPDEMQEDDKDHSEINGGSSDDDAAGSSVADEKKSSLDAKIDKKKMKRFRLTHNQTRFLMSEFTRQAHPDAAHRERLSREIPGLTPRQVQVWFQNRRAKLKRLTSNDRERMLKSRALPDDFDTTQVLRTPFGSRGPSESGLLTEGLPRLNDDEYGISPLSSASTNGPGYPTNSSDRGFESYQNRGAAATVPDLRSNRAFPFPRSSSFSESSFNTGLQFPSRFTRPGDAMGHAGMQYRRPMDYVMNRPGNGMMAGYDQHRPLEGSVSPNGQPESQMPYGMDNASPQIHNYQSTLSMPAPKAYSGMEMSSHMQPSRTMPTLHHLPVSEASEYRPYSYEHHPYSMSPGIPFTQANASSLSLPATFPSETGHVAVSSSPDERMNNSPHVMAKYSQGYEYANYL